VRDARHSAVWNVNRNCPGGSFRTKSKGTPSPSVPASLHTSVQEQEVSHLATLVRANEGCVSWTYVIWSMLVAVGFSMLAYFRDINFGLTWSLGGDLKWRGVQWKARTAAKVLNRPCNKPIRHLSFRDRSDQNTRLLRPGLVGSTCHVHMRIE